MNSEKNKCNQYEWLFTTLSEADFQKHLEICEDCRREHEKMLKVGTLVREVSQEYLNKQQEKLSMMKKIACCLVLVCGFSGFLGFKVYDSYSFQVNSVDDSVISEMGLPVDEYGFLEI